MKDLGH